MSMSRKYGREHRNGSALASMGLAVALFSAWSVGEAKSSELRDLLPESIQKSNVIKSGAMFAFPPTVMPGEDGRTLAGTVPELADAVGKVLGVKFEWADMQWPAQLPGLQAGTVDVLWGQVSITPEREKSIVDLVPWTMSEEMMLIPADNPHGLTSLENACGLRVATPVGSRQQKVVAEASDNCTKQGKAAVKNPQYRDTKSAIAGLTAGNADAYVDTLATLGYAAKQSRNRFTTVPSGIEGSFGGIAVAKQNTGLTQALQGALKKVIADGTYQKIMEKYGVEGGAIKGDDVEINPYTRTPVGQKS